MDEEAASDEEIQEEEPADERCAEPSADGRCAEHPAEGELNQLETPLGLDPTLTPSYVQLLAAFQTQLREVENACQESQKLQETTASRDNIEATTAAAAAEEKVQRKIIDLRSAAQKLSEVNFEAKAKEIEGVMEGLFVPSQGALSMFDPPTWTKCFVHFWFGDALPNQDRDKKLTFEQIFLCLLDRSELQYDLDNDDEPYRAPSKSRFDEPDFVLVAGDTLRRLLMFRGTRVAFKRKGYQKDVSMIAKASSEMVRDAYERLLRPEGSAGQPPNDNAERLAGNDALAQELRTALRQMLIATKDVPFTDGSKRALRHEGHALNVTYGSLQVFATYNFADSYSAVSFKLLNNDEDSTGSDGRSAAEMGEMSFMLSPDAPEMPTLKDMHKLIAQSPRAQSKFFILMDDIVDIYLLGFDQSFYGRHQVRQSFHQSEREDSLASTGMPALGGYGIAELEGMESQERGFQHGHRKKYGIPRTKEQHVIDLFKEKDETVLNSLLKAMKDALVLCAETLQYEASTLPAAQMQQKVLPEKFTKKQQIRSRLDGGIDLDGSVRPLLESTKEELPGHHVLEYRRAAQEAREPRPTYSQVSLQGCHQSLMPSYRLPQSVGSIRILDEVGMVQNVEHQETTAPLPYWSCAKQEDHVTRLGQDEGREPTTVLNSLIDDANAWALSFCRDFRALHQLNHDHDCTSTCIKYVKKGKENAEKALQKGWTVACRFFFYHILILTYMCSVAQKVITKAIRRRGKKLVPAAHIATTNDHGELFRVMVKRDTPFRSASSDVALVWSRSNNDFQFMARFLDNATESGAAQPAASSSSSGAAQPAEPPAVDPKLALAMYGVRQRLPDAPLLRRCFHSIAAMFQAAHNCDYYITKYQAKALALMQNLLFHMALGFRQLEEEEEATVAAGGVAQGSQERARRVTLKIVCAANRCSWVSCCEMASFIRTGGDARRTHRPVQVFLSRPMYLLKECQRRLQRPARELLETPDIQDESFRPLDVVALQTVVQEEEQLDLADNTMQADDCSDCHEDEDMESSDTSSERDTEDREEPVADSVVLPVLDSAAQPVAEDAAEHEETNAEETSRTTGLMQTTSAHDDWLHRGPFLYELDFHTYVRYVHREPLARNPRKQDADRMKPVFLFDSHYALAKEYMQELDTQGTCKVVVLEALKCPSPELNHGEDNAAFKSILGSLLKCPGRGECNNPLICRKYFFQCRHAKSDDEPSVFTSRHQWKARRAEIEVLAREAEGKSNDAMRIPVLADVTLLRSHPKPEDTMPSKLSWSAWLVYSQLWMRISQGTTAEHQVYTQLGVYTLNLARIHATQAYPCWAPRILRFLGHDLHHPTQLSLAEFAAFHLRDVIFNLDMLTIARTAKLTPPTEKIKAEDEKATTEAEKDAVLNSLSEMCGEMAGADEDVDIENEETSVERTIALHNFDMEELKEMLFRVREVAEGKKKGRKNTPICK